MISNTTRSRNPAWHAGLLENLLALANALRAFVRLPGEVAKWFAQRRRSEPLAGAKYW